MSSRRALIVGVLCLSAWLVAPASAEAQNIIGGVFRLKAGPCTMRSGSGSPNGVQAGRPCDTWKDTVAGVTWWKLTGEGTTTGWITWSSLNTATYLMSRDASGDSALRNLRATSIFGNAGAGANQLTLGGTGAGCTDFPNCQANAFTFDGSRITQRLRTDLSHGSQWYVTKVGGGSVMLNAYNASGWMPLRLFGGPTRFGGGGVHVGTSDILDPGLGNAQIDGFIGKPGYVSQTTGWRIDGLGGADFRNLFTDQLHAKVFTVDLTRVLAGVERVTKSGAIVGAPFTVPAPGSISTLTVRDYPSAPNMAVFEAGDYVHLRQFSRASGSLSITDGYGTVTGYTDLADGLQSWQFTRLVTNGGAMATGTVIEADASVLDEGVSGNGWIETNAIDGVYGVNSPYVQAVTWAGASPIAANQTVRTRLGNLGGITGNTGEFGLIAGTYGATDGNYFIGSNQRFELHGIDLKLWDGSTNVYRLDHATPFESMGSPAPTTYGAGVGCWSGMDAGVYKWRCGDPEGHNIAWTGTSLNVVGNIVVEGFIAEDTNNVNGVASATVASGAARANLGLTSAGNPALPATAAPSGSGLFLGSDFMGYYASGAWQTYMTNAGNFFLGGASGPLQWNAATSTLTITGTINVTGGTAAKTDLSNVTGGYAASSTVGGAATSLVNQGALATVNSAAWGTQVSGRPEELTDGRITTALGSNGALQNAVAAPTSGAGLKLGSDHLGFYDGAAWKTYMDNTGQFFLGGPSGKLQWNGSALTIEGTITVTGGNAAKTDFTNVTANYAGSASVGGSANDTTAVNGVAAATVSQGAQRANTALNSSGTVVTKVIPASAVAPSGAGLHLGSDFLGYYNGAAWRTYMDNSGNFYLGGTSGALQWNAGTSTLTISATLSGNGSGITSVNGGNITSGSVTSTQIQDATVTGTDIAATTIAAGNIANATITGAKIAATTITGGNIVTGTITATQIAALTITASQIAADAVTGDKIIAGAVVTSRLAADAVTSDKILAGTIVADDIAGGTITGNKIRAGTITADLLNVTTLSAITANLGTVTAGTIDGVTIRAGSGDEVTLDNTGITLSAGAGINNKIKWSDGLEIWSASAGNLFIDGGVSTTGDILSTGNNARVQADIIEAINELSFVNMPSSSGTIVIWESACACLKKSTSSLRYKENVTPWVPKNAEALLDAQAIRFDYVGDNAKGVVGLSAESVYAIAPEAVNVDSEGRPDSIRQDAINAYLFQILRALRAELAQLKSARKE